MNITKINKNFFKWNSNGKTKVGFVILISSIVLLSATVWFAISNNKNNQLNNVNGKARATVFYSPTCGCCINYIGYLKGKGFEVETIRETDLSNVKKKYGIPSNLESCHTSLIDNYVVEGHMPVEAISKLLTEKPNIKGIALAGMPQGSPGMPGGKTSPFKIYTVPESEGEEKMFMEF